jgi:hypothetical protein
LYKD